MTRALIATLLLAPAALGADPEKRPEWFGRATTAFAVSCEPHQAKAGQTVTLAVELTLADGYTVYPLVQADPAAVGMVSKIDFPKPGSVIFVGQTADPAGAKSKAEPELGIAALNYYAGKVAWKRQFVVNPSQPPGELLVTLPAVKFAVCDKDSCFPPRGFAASAKLTVLGGPAAPVEARYAAEVAKALAAK